MIPSIMHQSYVLCLTDHLYHKCDSDSGGFTEAEKFRNIHPDGKFQKTVLEGARR